VLRRIFSWTVIFWAVVAGFVGVMVI